MFFSLIIPAYNLEGYIVDCLSSIHAQSCQDFECIVVDDGSTDGTAAVIEGYIVDKPRFRLIRKQNGGVSSARNLGLEHAQGEYIWFIDGDDYIHPGSLVALHGWLANAQLDVLVFDYDLTRQRYNEVVFDEVPSLELETIRDNLMSRLSLAPASAWRCCFRASIARKIEFLPICTSEDALYVLQFIFGSMSLGCAHGFTPYYYYQRESSFVHARYTMKSFRDYSRYIEATFALAGQCDGDGDGYLSYQNYRMAFPHLYRKLRELESKERHEAWSDYLDLLSRHCELFGKRSPWYMHAIAKYRSQILAWICFVVRNEVQLFLQRHPALSNLYRKVTRR